MPVEFVEERVIVDDVRIVGGVMSIISSNGSDVRNGMPLPTFTTPSIHG